MSGIRLATLRSRSKSSDSLPDAPTLAPSLLPGRKPSTPSTKPIGKSSSASVLKDRPPVLLRQTSDSKTRDKTCKTASKTQPSYVGGNLEEEDDEGELLACYRYLDSSTASIKSCTSLKRGNKLTSNRGNKRSAANTTKRSSNLKSKSDITKSSPKMVQKTTKTEKVPCTQAEHITTPEQHKPMQCLCIRPPVCPLHPHGPPGQFVPHSAPHPGSNPTYPCPYPGQNTSPWPEPFIIPGPAMGQVMQGMGIPPYIPGAYYFPHFLAIPLPQGGGLTPHPWSPYHTTNNKPQNEDVNQKEKDMMEEDEGDRLEMESSPPPVLVREKKRKASTPDKMVRPRKRVKIEKVSATASESEMQSKAILTEKRSPAEPITPLTIKIQRAVDSTGQPTLRVSPSSEKGSTSIGIAERVESLPTPPPTAIKSRRKRGTRSRRSSVISSNWTPIGQPTKKWVYVGNAWKPIRVDCFKSIGHKQGIETLHERDTVLVCSADKQLADIAKIARFFQDPHDKSLWASVVWYYRKESVPVDCQTHLEAQELLASRHIDRIPVDSIQDVCYVLTPNEYARYKAENRLDSRCVSWSGPEIVSRGEKDYSRRQLQPAEDTTEDAVFFVRQTYDFPKKSLFSNIRKNYAWVPFFAG